MSWNSDSVDSGGSGDTTSDRDTSQQPNKPPKPISRPVSLLSTHTNLCFEMKKKHQVTSLHENRETPGPFLEKWTFLDEIFWNSERKGLGRKNDEFFFAESSEWRKIRLSQIWNTSLLRNTMPRHESDENQGQSSTRCSPVSQNKLRARVKFDHSWPASEWKILDFPFQWRKILRTFPVVKSWSYQF